MEIYYHMLACAACRHPNLDIAVACSAMPDVPQDFAYPYPVYRARSLSVLTPYFYRRSVARMIQREGIDILLGPMLHGGGHFAVGLKEKYGMPVLVQSHGSDVQRVESIRYGATLDPVQAAKVRHTIREADAILAVSKFNRKMIVDLGAAADRVNILQSGVDLPSIERVPYVDMRRRYGIKQDEFVIMTVGRNRPIKRLDLLLDALVLLKNRGTAFRYLCVGPVNDLHGDLSQRGLETNAILTGKIGPTDAELARNCATASEMVNLYRAADLFACVSYMEAQSLAVLDALATGVPALVTPNQGAVDYIEEGRNGFVLRNETPAALATLLLNFVEKLREIKARKNEIKRSVAHLTWDNSVRELYDVACTLLREF